MSASNIQVAIKVRPILRKEKEQNQTSNWKVSGNSIQLIDGQPEPFYFDHIFDQDVNNQTIFDTMAKQIVDAGLKGFNGTIFAYGQTSSGKTYTMMGDERNPGVMVLATKEIFKEIGKATDRQFLLRVGYIEIYNEKIYDLLNKSNQDLKIHETPNGEVNVNCSEYIITCEDDLLNYLCIGSKQRKIGETNMNERSSRSHAIFRIIIESRKMDKTDDDSVQISILNLVDLAGSERADQTGATGSRLKEGSHINKSLLFLSCVIKQLAEDKYVSYRDSKLTRILQASLGGNALAAIICTVNPTAVEETLSTLNFANRAKVVKNKPQVNEILTDAAMMKRLEKEINRLQNELEVEKTKNSQIKVGQLQKRLNEEILKIINSNSHSIKSSSDKRRRTWCPSSDTPPLVEVNSVNTETCLPQPAMPSQIPTKLQLPKTHFNFTPHITLRDEYYQQQLKGIECIEEEFLPAEEVCFDDVLTPRASPKLLKLSLHTPTDALKIRTASLTPRLTDKESLQKLEKELKELETFTNLENKLNVEHDTLTTLKHQLENANRVIMRYEKEREEFAFVRVEHLETVTNFKNCQKRCQELESRLLECESKATQLEKSSQADAERIVRYEQQVTELKTKITQLEMENREVVSLEIEFQQHKNKAKRRETELLDVLEEKQNQINKLERSLQTITAEVHNNSKEELQQLSKGHNGTESVCVNCSDLQRILSENNQLTQDIEKLNLDNKELQRSLDNATADVESTKLQVDYLEKDNIGLKQDVEQFKAAHGALQELQQQIATLQAEKCKLESVKIEFEVMSKETASKIAEKINISQEIQTLTTQKDSLAADCDKLSAELTANESVKHELNTLRTENTSLHSELQTIKTKLESAQSDYLDLMSENRSKSDNYEKLNMEVLSARNQLQTLQNEYRDIQQKYEQIQAECNKHEGTIGEIQSEYESIQTKYQCLQREYEKLENDSVQSIADCDRVQTENESLETEIRELKFKVEEAQRKLMENDSLQVELESLRSEMNRLQGEYDRKRKSASPIKEDSTDLRQENAKLKHDLENLQQQFNDMQKEYDDISTQLVDTFADYESLQADMAALEKELKQYKEATTDEIKSMKGKIDQLQVENAELLKENVEWKKTISSMTQTLREKCNEKEQLAAQLNEVRNESATQSQSPRKSIECCEQFLKLSQRFVEIEVPIGNGATRTFRASDYTKSSAGSKMLIGNISDITQGMFNGFRGAIEFAIATWEYNNGNDIYDSLDNEDNSTSTHSCDSLEDTNKQVKEKEIKELTEEKVGLFERVRNLEEALSALKMENDNLTLDRKRLDNANRSIEQLNEEKNNLKSMCDESRRKIIELNEVLSRAECDNQKLMTDCEKLQTAMQSESAAEKVSREIYDELKHQHEKACEQLAHTSIEFEKQAAKLRRFDVERSLCQCDKYKEDIISLEDAIIKLSVELDKSNEKCSTCAELKTTMEELQAQLQNCKCNELQAALNEKNEQLASVESETTTKLAQDICVLQEQLKQQECKCQEVQIEIIELRTSLEEKVQEFAECSAKFEDLNVRYTKLQTDYDDLQKMLDFEREASLQTVNGLVEERQGFIKETEELRKERDEVGKNLERTENEKKQLTAQCEVLRSSERSLHGQLQKLVEEHELIVRDKEKLERECDTSTKQLEDLQGKYETNTREQYNLQNRCKELEDNLTILQNEKNRLRNEVEDAEMQLQNLKEEHKGASQALDEKYSALKRENDQLEAARNELQSALDESKKRTDFLLQESKDLEEQANQELCTVRNSNNLMAQEIEILREKLEEAENELKVAQDKLNLEKDEQITEITAKCTEIEQKLEAELNSKKLVEESISVKDRIIDELTAKQSKLEENLQLLTAQLAELKRSLATETHLKEVLEKAIAERDDLIVQLTNSNNSLATDNSELEQKLAILGNQFDESKRHFATEVNKLKQLLTETNEKGANQIGKIDDLTNKIADLEGELKKAKATVTERNSLLQKLDKLQTDYDALTIKHANLELTRSSFEAELNTARTVVIENTMLNAKMKDIQSALNEVQLKCESLSAANKELQASNESLTKQVEGISTKAGECERLNEEIVTLRAEIEGARSDLSKTKEEFTKKLSDWEFKKTSFMTQIFQLQSNASNITSERKSLEDKLMAAEKTSAKKIAQLEQQIEILKNQQKDYKPSKSLSPRKEKSDVDLLMGENQQTKVKNMCLMDKLDSCQKSQNEERKNRRLSTHDERRLQSFWDCNRDVSTMTEPTNSECNCSELDRKLTEMKQKLLIRDSQVNTLSMELKNHPLKSQYETVKNLLMEEESKQQQLQLELKKYKQLAANRTYESRQCNKCAESAKRITLDTGTQTIESDESECYRKLLSKYEDLKMICRVRHTKIKELEEALSKGKENAGDNHTSLHHQQMRQKYEHLKKEFKVLQEKYEEAKILCNHRYELLKNLPPNHQMGNS